MKCPYEECTKEANTFVYSREKNKVVKVCFYHAEKIVDEGSPEYIKTCPKCGCLMPVN